jgi:hypothetical protein
MLQDDRQAKQMPGCLAVGAGERSEDLNCRMLAPPLVEQRGGILLKKADERARWLVARAAEDKG